MTTTVNESLPRLTKKILVGRDTNGNTIYVLQVDTSNGFFSITYDGYDDVLLDDDSGERTAREYLEDGELWRMAVDGERTELGLDDFIEEVLNIDGWQETIGDVEDIGRKNGIDYYARLISCGAGSSNDYLDIDELKITKKELKAIAKAVDELHLKKLEDFNAQETNQAKEVIAIFNKHKEFESEQLLQYIVLGGES